MNVISVNRLYRKFSNGTVALNGISFSVKKGEVFGLLGPNGAGKSTTIKILTTILAPSEGEAKVFGLNTFGEEKKIREKINFVFGGERSLYWRLSAHDNLTYFADLYKIPKKIQNSKIIDVLNLVGLSDKSHLKVETFSKGMKQRLQIARALLNDPEIIFLDEPSIGLDPVGARDLRNLIKKLSKQGTTILLTTHYMPEAEELCDRIAIINHGEIVALGDIEALQKIISDEDKRKIINSKLNNLNSTEVTLEDIYLQLIGG